jgi:hypothetical protein
MVLTGSKIGRHRMVQTRARVGTARVEGEGKAESQTDGRIHVAAVEKGVEEEQWRDGEKLQLGIIRCEWP